MEFIFIIIIHCHLPGYVAPVLIDILCPKNKLPKLNNGHLESAITLSLGPNDIYARFGKKLTNLIGVNLE